MLYIQSNRGVVEGTLGCNKVVLNNTATVFHKVVDDNPAVYCFISKVLTRYDGLGQGCHNLAT